MRIFDERKYLYIIFLLQIIITYMKKYFIFILSIFILFWCSENADEKTVENINTRGEEISVEINQNATIETFLKYASSACYGGDIFLKTSENKKTIFNSANNSQNNFPYCSPKIEKISDDSAKIYICYWGWGGSGECSAGEFEYMLWSNSWKFISHGYYTTRENNSYSYNIEENNSWEDLKEFLEYMKNKKYIMP